MSHKSGAMAHDTRVAAGSQEDHLAQECEVSLSSIRIPRPLKKTKPKCISPDLRFITWLQGLLGFAAFCWRMFYLASESGRGVKTDRVVGSAVLGSGSWFGVQRPLPSILTSWVQSLGLTKYRERTDATKSSSDLYKSTSLMRITHTLTHTHTTSKT